jgi:hypothetical protein
MPNAQAHLLPEAGAERSEAEAVGSQVQRFVRLGMANHSRLDIPVPPMQRAPV